ncbi:transposase, partial [Cyanobacterium stanieri LEGE 03274]|nr:transposase [Cyanobacterium stanieri LEGE 03274]
MFILEYKLRGKPPQFKAIDEGIRTVQFVRNKCVSLWMNSQNVGKAEVYRYTTTLR